jgi:pyruvate/2-oxoglutarate dehydrogenase complex dihydrolipoamide dehydrogenase (E3) component
VANIYALGDVCGRVELTPVAIAAGRQLAERLFNNKPNAKLGIVHCYTTHCVSRAAIMQLYCCHS